MKELAGVFTAFKLITLGFCVMLLHAGGVSDGRIAVWTLAFCCLVVLQLFFNIADMNAKVRFASSLVIVLLVIVCRRTELLPVFLMELMTLLYLYKKSVEYYVWGIILTLFVLFFFRIGLQESLFSLLLLFAFFCSIECAERMKRFKDIVMEQRRDISSLQQSLQDNRQLIKSIRYATALEERNRLAVRLHDKVGHNISGSIILLEASLLQMEKKPAKAKESIELAVDNLRTGVDEIRKALREERPMQSRKNSQDIQLLLDEARAKYGLHTSFRTEGNMEKLLPEHWLIIQENVTELLTNVIKHSKGDSFAVTIRVMSAMIQVKYQDNGCCDGHFRKGMGLGSIEERTLRAGGKCFFEAGELGFHATNVFVL